MFKVSSNVLLPIGGGSGGGNPMKRPRLTLSSSNSSAGRVGHPGGGSGSGGVRSAVGGSGPQGGGVSRHGMGSGGGAAGVGLGGGIPGSMLSVTDVDVRKGILVQVRDDVLGTENMELILYIGVSLFPLFSSSI